MIKENDIEIGLKLNEANKFEPIIPERTKQEHKEKAEEIFSFALDISLEMNTKWMESIDSIAGKLATVKALVIITPLEYILNYNKAKLKYNGNEAQAHSDSFAKVLANIAIFETGAIVGAQTGLVLGTIVPGVGNVVFATAGYFIGGVGAVLAFNELPTTPWEEKPFTELLGEYAASPFEKEEKAKGSIKDEANSHYLESDQTLEQKNEYRSFFTITHQIFTFNGQELIPQGKSTTYNYKFSDSLNPFMDKEEVNSYSSWLNLDKFSSEDTSLASSVKSWWYNSWVSNNQLNIFTSTPSFTSSFFSFFNNKKDTSSNNNFNFNDKFSNLFTSINRDYGNTQFDIPIIDSFIKGDYSDFKSFDTNLFKPFSSWKSDFTQDLGLTEMLKLFETKFSKTDYTYFDQKTCAFNKNNNYDSFAFMNSERIDPTQYSSSNYQKSFSQIRAERSAMAKSFEGSWINSRDMSGARQSKYTSYNGRFTLEYKIYPIAIGLQDTEISFIKLNQSSIFFDTNDDGYLENVAWINKFGALLVYDYNKDGLVTEAKEIILTIWDSSAKTDFDALKNKFDSNNDQVFDNKDKEFSKFLIWQDHNQDAIAQASELRTLYDVGIKSISLNFTPTNGELLEEYNVVNLAEISWSKGKNTYAYDWAMSHSKYGVKIEFEENNVNIKQQIGDSQKIYINKADQLNLILQNCDYDMIVGSAKHDYIKIINSTGVLIDTGDGDDEIIIDMGNNWVKPGAGKDSIKTGSGHDILFIDSDDIKIDAGEGIDIAFVVDKKNIKLNLSDSNIEVVYSNDGDDYLNGMGTSAVQIFAGNGDDEIIGSDSDDILVGGGGKDKIKAGKGNDLIFIDSSDDLSFIDAGEGEDSIYLTTKDPINIDLDKLNAENFFGNDGDDNIIATGNKNYFIHGGAGNDDITGGTKSTTMDGGAGHNILRGGIGSNLYIFSQDSGNNIIISHGINRGDNKDYVIINSSISLKDLSFKRTEDSLLMSVAGKNSSILIKDWFKGNQYKIDGFIYKAEDKDQVIILYEGNDRLFLNDKSNWIIFTLSDGNSLIEAGKGDNFIKTGKGDDLVICDGGNDIVFGGEGDDELLASDNKDYESIKTPVELHGEEGNDYLIGAGGPDILYGGAGRDNIFGHGGNDIIHPGDDDQTVFSKGGNDNVYAGDGDDIVYLEGSGVKQIIGGDGNDLFIIIPNNYTNHSVYTILDYEIKNPLEKIDFSHISHIHSLKDLKIGDRKLEIDPSSVQRNGMNPSISNYEIVDVKTLCWSVDDEVQNTPYRCVWLPKITTEDLIGADAANNFIFSEA